MKNIEFIEKDVADNFLTLHYWKDEKEMSLLLNLPDLIDLLYKTDQIDEWDEGTTFDDTTVMFDEIYDPMGPDEDETVFAQNISLAHFIAEMTDWQCEKVIKYHESLKEADKMSITGLIDSIGKICKDNEKMMSDEFPSSAWTEGAKNHPCHQKKNYANH